MASNKHQRTSSHPIHTTTKKSTSHSKTISVISGEALNSALIKPVDLNVLLTESDRQQKLQALREKLLKKSLAFLKKKCKLLKISAQGNKSELIHKIIQHQQTNHKDNKQHHLSKPKRNDLNSKSYNKSNKNKTRNKNDINDKKKKKKKKKKKNKTKQKTEDNISTNKLEENVVKETVIAPTNKSVNTSADKCSQCTFINVLATKTCAMCGFEKLNENNEEKCNTQRGEMEIVTLLVDGYINNIGQLSNLQIIPIEINAICFEYYYFTLKRWLRCACCLPQYFGAFSMNGFNELSVVSLIESREYLQNIDIIPTIHQNKIWTEIVKLQQENGKNDCFQFYYSTSTNRIERWLESFGLRQYFQLFDNPYAFIFKITRDIESIHQLEEIGIKLKGHQMKIWDEIKKLKRKEEIVKERERMAEMEKEKERMEKEKEILEYRHKLYLIQKQKEEKESEKLKEEIREWNREKIYIQKGQKNIAYLYNDNISVNKKVEMIQRIDNMSVNKKAEMIQRIKKESYKYTAMNQCWCEKIKTAPKNYTFNVSISDGAYLCNSCRSYQLPPYDDAI